MNCSTAPSDRGLLVVVVGASGAGKDSLLSVARQHFDTCETCHFVRRVITRPDDELNEPHRSVDVATFDAMRRAGEFVVHWQAHGLYYGIPIDTIEALRRGHLVILNGSRAALPMIRARFPRRQVVHVVVPDAELERRLALRGRESGQELASRMAREIDATVFERESVWTLDNSVPLATSSRAFVARLQAWQQSLTMQSPVD